jgi:hypothetical protein
MTNRPKQKTRPHADPLNVTLVLIIIAAVIFAAIATDADARSCARPSQGKIASLDTQYPRFKRALVRNFGRSWKEAAVVSWGEGSWHHWASNGQYQGTFQMGSWARSRYGHSNTLAGQAAAAARYWRNSGWSGWECKP